MSSTTDKIKGLANEAAGNIKQGVGKATGNENLQAKGDVKEGAQHVADKVTGKA